MHLLRSRLFPRYLLCSDLTLAFSELGTSLEDMIEICGSHEFPSDVIDVSTCTEEPLLTITSCIGRADEKEKPTIAQELMKLRKNSSLFLHALCIVQASTRVSACSSFEIFPLKYYKPEHTRLQTHLSA